MTVSSNLVSVRSRKASPWLGLAAFGFALIGVVADDAATIGMGVLFAVGAVTAALVSFRK